MRLVSFDAPGAPARVGILAEDHVRPTQYTDMVAAIESGDFQPVGASLSLDSVRFLAPIARPGVIFGSGINYRSHQRENPSASLPDVPGFFVKLSSAVIGPGEAIRLPFRDSHTDYEVELAVVIGRPGRAIEVERAWDHVFGVTVINDVSERITQFTPNQNDLGKGCDSFCPMGPSLLTLDEAPTGAFRLMSYVNDEPRQDASTDEMLFSIPELIAHVSRHVTLRPGDVISTGTPEGCGTFRRPPVWLQPGDVVRVGIEGIGELVNPVVAGWVHSSV